MFWEQIGIRLFQGDAIVMASSEDLQDLPSDKNVISLGFGGHNEDVLNKAKDILAAATKHAIVRVSAE